MARVECDREQEILDALCAGRWPERCEPALQAHVTACAVCCDLVDAAGPLLQERDVVWTDVRVPSPGTVWWRAQLRARREAAREAARPITVAQAVAGVVTVALAIALATLLAPSISAWLPAPASLLSVDLSRFTLPDVERYGSWSRVVLLVAGTWLVLTPVAIYLAVNDD